jgi:glycerate-2-kinase
VLESHANSIFRAALRAVDPGPATQRALRFAAIPNGSRLYIIATGKAAPAMAAAAVEQARAIGVEPAGGLVVSHTESPSPHPAIESITGDHPVPGARSARASVRLEEVVRQVRPQDVVWVLLSGGTSSLIGAPHSTLTPGELAELQELLLGSGLPIGKLNIIRKRFSRWGAGRLAQALEPARVRFLAISDVPDDDIAAIGSGPLSPDPATIDDVKSLLQEAGLWGKVPRSVREVATRAADAIETPKPGDPVFDNVTGEVIASNSKAVEAALVHAHALGYDAHRAATPLTGEAADAGVALARELIAAAGRADPMPLCLVQGGETVVTLGDVEPNVMGGRAQELALAAAEVLAGASGSLVLLAAGTDGRDGPTDAAGALVTPATWSLIRSAGRDPTRDLARHDAYRALDAAGALVRTGPTGTNVMDLVIMLAG